MTKKEELDLLELNHEPLIEITIDGKQVWIEDKLVWEESEDGNR